MVTIYINDLRTLRERFASQSADSLFRGQVAHYESQDGAPKIDTSFNRKGCVPPMMIKWQHYAKEILRVLSGPESDAHGNLTDAILQHYGWRSFFVDVTLSPAVAAWFASHSYSSLKPIIEMTEGVNEEFVILVHNAPKYVPVDGPGNIYIISKSKAETESAKFIDLTEIECEGTQPRFHAQRGCLIGPLSRLSPLAIVERWIVPMKLLSEVAAEGGLHRTEDLFPARENDIFLKLLLAVPWEHASGEASDPIFRRGLDIPEYDFRTTRRYLLNEAFYRRAWISRADHIGRTSLLTSAVRFGVGEESFYYHVDSPPKDFKRLLTILEEHPVILVETDGLVRRPEGYNGDEYTKGMAIHRIDEHLVHISELAAQHPGGDIVGARVLAPWTYRISDDRKFLRDSHKNDCPCNNPSRHEDLFRYAQVFERLLREGSFRKISDLEYRHTACTTN
jgi:hypothetical protein